MQALKTRDGEDAENVDENLGDDDMEVDIERERA